MSSRAKAVLFLSLLANLFLCALLVWPQNNSRARDSAAPSDHQSNASLADAWQQLRRDTTGNDAAYVERLRSEGFPPEMLRAFLRAEIAERHASERRTLLNASGLDAYWRSQSARYRNDRPAAALRALGHQEETELYRLLGDEALSTWAVFDKRQRYGNLPVSRLLQVEAVVRDYNDLYAQALQESGFRLLLGDKTKPSFLKQEQTADLAALLTPKELEAYELRSSDTANTLKQKLYNFEATESEYIAIYKLQKVYYDSITAGTLTAGARAEAQDRLKRDVEAALGEERYRDYTICTDTSYDPVNLFATNLGLTDGTAKELVSYKLDAVQRWIAIKRDTSLGQEQRSAKIAVLVEEAKAALTAKLGTKGFGAYSENEAIGSWIANIAKSTGAARQ